ncbi:uncharacterized protein LOC112691000 [Sipha flava]|uniref:Uncharacterized protein LOC112691000 n=1 Tax=Sipha flava TaxID=143950 RepID=A0A8B8GE03_9HEMI|nr:uncharacterized protein LOC112691000 [Sipha flava]
MKTDGKYNSGDIEYAQSEDIGIMRWKDRGSKPVTLVSNMHNSSDTSTVLRKNGKGERIQDIGLRGHNNVIEYSNEDEHDLETTKNQGNFKELLDILCLENEKFNINLKSLPKKAKYTSNKIQNDILFASSDVILQTIIREVNEGSSVYSLIVDEAQRFLGFVQVEELDALGLTNSTIEFLNSVGLDITKCISQSYDGASVMSGSTNGVQVKIRELSKNKCPYIHCYAHRLNLVLVDVAKSVEIVDNTIGSLETIYAFQSSSTLRYKIFSDVQKDCEIILKVPQHSDTRWVAKYKGVWTVDNIWTSSLSFHLQAIIFGFSEIADIKRSFDNFLGKTGIPFLLFFTVLQAPVLCSKFPQLFRSLLVYCQEMGFGYH